MKYFLGLILVCTQLLLVAQKHNFRHFTVEDGLPSLSISEILQDNQGYIWMASDKGISKFDGYKFRTYTVQDGLPSNNVKHLFADAYNRLWLFMEDAPLTYLYENQIYQIAPDQKFTINQNGIKTAPDGTVWFDTYQGLYHYEGDSLSLFEAAIDKKLVQITENGDLWFTEDFSSEWMIYDGATFKRQPIGLDSMEIMVGNVEDWGERGLVFKTFQNVYIYKDTLRQLPYEIQRKLSNQNPPLIVSQDEIWTLDEELNRTNIFGLNDLYVDGAYEDKEKNWWLNTSGDGVYLLTANARNSITFDIEEGLEDQKITAITKPKKSTITFAGTLNGDFYLLYDSLEIPVQIPIDNARNINELLYDDKQLYLASGDGLFIFDLQNMIEKEGDYTLSFSLGMCFDDTCRIERTYKNYLIRGLGSIKDISIKNKTLYVATSQRLWSLGMKEDFFDLKTIVNDNLNAVAMTKDGFWIGKNEGLFFYEKDTLIAYKGKHKLLAKKINDLLLHDNNDLWVGTDGFGIYTLIEGKVQQIKETSRDLVQKLYVDVDDNIWAATNNGLHKIRITNRSPFTYSIRSYTATDGLATNEVNTVFSDNKALYIGTNRGFTIIEKQELSKFTPVPPVYITNVNINSQDTTLLETYSLPYYKNDITIEFVGLSYKSNTSITYLYKMDGIDEKWQTTNITERTYPGLKPNKYTFRIKARDVEGMESEEKTVVFWVRPPFWQTWWFRILSGIGLAGLILYLTQWRINTNRRRDEEKNILQLQILEQKAEKERVSKALATSKLETLQAQMNPHFAYNALTSIQKFILTSNKREANRYLVKFARLMRQFLEASKERFIPLKKELDLLELYIEMEALRFKDKFDYRIEIDPAIDTQAIQIPSMLLQIYVENAINHGLVYKPTKGNLLLKVTKSDGYVTCIVQDDGIGREKAQAIKDKSVGSYKGLGMKISKERLHYLNMTQDKKVHIEIHDDVLGEEKGGTAVEVRIEV